MYLEKLQLNGFKSFAQKVELKFNRGVTAIVGPNGSGKSNIADAIRWVLGEQSMKSIRGKKSADVIFAGSSKKSQLGMAEVTLHFNNEDHQAPLDYSEVVLSRRFYRSGEGEYLLNNGRTRLVDIQMMLAQANIGSKTYSVIGQGQIDSVLVATPVERKEFFDEATGVKQYQIKRDQALHKLERACANISQGKLMLGEIKPRLRSLTRQVRRLEQKELVEKELIGLQQYYYYSLWQEYANGQERISKDREALLADLKKHEQALAVWQSDMNQLGGGKSRPEEFASLQMQYEDKQADKQKLLRELVVLEGRRDLDLAESNGQDMVWATRRLREVDELLEKKQQLQAELKKIIKELEATLAAEQNKQSQLLAEFRETDGKFKNMQNKSVSRVTLPEVKLSIQGAVEKLKQLQSAVAAAANINEMKVALKAVDDIHDSLIKLIHNLPETTDSQPGSSLDDLRIKLEELALAKETLWEKLSDIKVEIKVSQSKLAAISEDLNGLAKEQAQLKSLSVVSSSDEPSQAAEEEIKSKLSAVDRQLNNISQQLKEFNQVQQDKKDRLLALQSKAQSTQQRINDINKQLANFDIELARFETKQEDVALEVHRELNTFMAGLVDDWKTAPPQLDEELSREEIMERISMLKKKREMIGGIEPEAAGEYQEVKERHDFLTGQVDDLTESMEKLTGSIDELDKIITKQFTDSFHHINDFFNKYFRMLFSGGRAELVLLKNDVAKKETVSGDSVEGEEEATVAEAEVEEDGFDLIKMYKSKRLIQGIDIKAVPPGKKMKGIGMLSGGERALTSIALICAMIANNPSPFVVLDEVDAALDEANSLRFAEILVDLAKKTQFVVITHNRATMEKADILYGVTMGSDGVSNFLSVKFDQAQEYANRY